MSLQDNVAQTVLDSLKRDNKGWDVALFESAEKISNSLCEHCNSVCCDAVELGCDHDDNDVFLYCHQCLNELITNNNQKCPINDHEKPIISLNRVSRRQILKSKVICPYSATYKLRKKQRNEHDKMNAHLIVTLGAGVDDDDDQKEGQQPTEEDRHCQWKGTLNDLIHKHLESCMKRHDPTFVYKQENAKLKQQIIAMQNDYCLQIEQNKKLTANVRELQAKIQAVEAKNDELQRDFLQEVARNAKLHETTKALRDELQQQAHAAETEKKNEDEAPDNTENINEPSTVLQNLQQEYFDAANRKQLHEDETEGLDATIVSTEHPGELYVNAPATMVWNLKNIGKKAFGENCQLRFVSGDGLLVSQYHVPDAKPNETVKVSLSFNAFSVPNSYETVFRLSHNEMQFGPQLVVQINVLDRKTMIPVQPIQPQSASPKLGAAPQSLFNLDDLDDAEEAKKEETKGWFGWGKKKKTMKKESNLSCLCGGRLIYIDFKQAYKGKKVYCDICSKLCKDNIFHCPAGDIRSHRGGFDLCYACGGSQLAKQTNPPPVEMGLSTPAWLDPLAMHDAAVGDNINTAAASSSSHPDEYDPNFLYPVQLEQLLDMGFD